MRTLLDGVLEFIASLWIEVKEKFGFEILTKKSPKLFTAKSFSENESPDSRCKRMS